MGFQISAWSIRNPIPVSLLFIVLMIAGWASYVSLPIKLYPDVTSPRVQVSVTLPGAAASEMESQVAREVEDAVANIAGVRHIQSTVVEGNATTNVEFEIGENPQTATDQIRTAVDRARNKLPRGIEEPIVEHLNFDGLPVLTYAVSAPGMSDIDLSWFIDDEISRRLTAVKGVAQVTRVGGVNREINVTLNPERLAARGLTASGVNDALRGYNVDSPGGRALVGSREQTVRVLGAAHSVERLGETVIPTSDGRRVRLADVATIQIGSGDRRSLAMLNGLSVVGFQVSKTSAASDVAMEDAVTHAIARLSAERKDVRFTLVSSTAAATRSSFEATMHTLIEGMILASLVVLLFLRDWRSTIIAALAMPISLVPSFAAMLLFGFSLNTITLLALTLVIGILVDDAIVEIENIEKRIHRGQTPFQAALEGADAIGLAVVATTASIIVVFLPVSAMPGVAGQFFKEFGLTVAVAVLFSLLVARLLTPLMAAYFMSSSRHDHQPQPFTGWYRDLLEWALAHRWLSIGMAALMFFGSIGLATQLPTGFTPDSDTGIVNLTIEGAPGATLSDMHTAAGDLTRRLERLGDVDNVFVTIGGSGATMTSGSVADVRVGSAVVLLSHDRGQTTQEFKARMRPILMKIPDVRLALQQGPGSGGTVQVLLAGDPADALERTALTLETQMRGIAGLVNVHQETPRPNAELVVRLRNDEAARLGVSSEAVASVVRVATMGDVDANVAKFDHGRQRLPVRVRLPEQARTDLAAIGLLRVPTATDGTVPLMAVADLSFQPGATRIERFDRARRISVAAELDGISLGRANEAIAALPVLQSLPQGVTHPAYGQMEDMQELFTGFIVAIISGVLLIFGVLVLLFRSFFKPATILAALPLSVAGAILGLLISGAQLDLPALIGILMLMGLVAKNSILLVEFAVEAERDGMSQHDALITACRERARPIIMTTLAMSAGMLPAALGIGDGAETRQPMAIAVIGGLISSTALSLVLVPVVYEVIDDIDLWVRSRLSRLTTGGEAPAADAA